MENRVDGLHGIRESECEGMGTWVCDDLEGSKILIREFLGGTCGVEVLSLYIDCISNCEVWWR